MDIKRGIDKAVAKVVESIKSQAETVGDNYDKIEQVARSEERRVGKTGMALHLARNAAMAGYAVAVYSLEMQGERLADRWLTEMCIRDSSCVGFALNSSISTY